MIWKNPKKIFQILDKKDIGKLFNIFFSFIFFSISLSNKRLMKNK